MSDHNHIVPKSIYYLIFLALMVGTGITWWVATIDLGMMNNVIMLAIAVTKATLVVLFFMHVKYSSRMTKMVVGLAVFFLLVMLGLTMTDYATRDWFASPRGSSGAGTSQTITHDGGTLRPSNQPATMAPKGNAPPVEHEK